MTKGENFISPATLWRSRKQSGEQLADFLRGFLLVFSSSSFFSIKKRKKRKKEKDK